MSTLGEVSDEMSADGLDFLPLRPPPLRHQRSSDMRFDEPESPPTYRSLAQGSSHESMIDDSYEEAPVYRSMFGLASADVAMHSIPYQAREEYFSFDVCEGGYAAHMGALEPNSSRDCKELPVYRSGIGNVDREIGPCLSALLNSTHVEEPATISKPSPNFVFELPAELLDEVLNFLDPCPDIFAAMLCSRSWRDAALSNYVRRRTTVPATPDALLLAVDCASPGDTLIIAAGIHTLSTEIAVDKPLRLVASPAGTTVLTSTHHVLLRTRCSALVEGLTLLRLGDEVGYPNAVVYAEAGALAMRHCRITCGGAAPNAEHAMQVFNNVPPAGQPWLGAERPSVPISDEAAPQNTAQDPQSGLWVGAAARVRLSKSTILCCQGPGIKIYRGELESEDNTIAFASRGANVVANGGKVVMLRNEIKGALGDGVSSWNNSHLSLDTNRIHANSGAGIAINTGGGAVNITKNLVFDNCCSAVLFATSQTKQATLSDNDLERNAAGGVQGLQQVAGQRFLHQQRRRSSEHSQRAAFSPPPMLLQSAGSGAESFFSPVAHPVDPPFSAES